MSLLWRCSSPLTGTVTENHLSVPRVAVGAPRPRGDPRGDSPVCWLPHQSDATAFSEILPFFNDHLSNQICYLRPDGFDGLLGPPGPHDLALGVDQIFPEVPSWLLLGGLCKVRTYFHECDFILCPGFLFCQGLHGRQLQEQVLGGGGRCHHSKSGQRAKHRPEQTSRSECPDPVHTHTEAPLTQDSATQSHEAMYLRSVALNNTKFVLSLAENFQFLGMFKDKMIF